MKMVFLQEVYVDFGFQNGPVLAKYLNLPHQYSAETPQGAALGTDKGGRSRKGYLRV
ncbi:MAG: hypothetical protein GQ535_16395 [Rhodobacteraceae bacterium]|nr:hypothetical protein [Paracoccaceae bacterium]